MTIEENSYTTISVTEYQVSYDQDISEIFNGTSFTRDGYTISGLNVGTDTFATYEDGTWTFADSDYIKENLYKYDGDLTLTTVWSRVNGYITAQRPHQIVQNIPVFIIEFRGGRQAQTEWGNGHRGTEAVFR